MKKQKKQAHSHKSAARSRPTTHRKTATTEDTAARAQRSDVSSQSEESKEGPDALNVHENGPVSNDIIGENK